MRHYANQLAKWAESCPSSALIIDGMIDQRVQLGLTGHNQPACATPLSVRPVVAVGRGVSSTLLDRMHTVHQRLVDAGLDDPPLEVYLVNLVGRLDRLDL